jgi:predicted DNA-binding transcriptional regulator AlpA
MYRFVMTNQCQIGRVVVIVEDPLLDTKQVHAMTGVTEATLRYWRHADQGPASFTLGPRGRVRYRLSEVERWLAEQEQTTRRGGVQHDAAAV